MAEIQEKGTYNGPCNRTACQKPGAKWFNRSTQKYYCDECAELLNRINYDSAEVLYGVPLCVFISLSEARRNLQRAIERNREK